MSSNLVLFSGQVRNFLSLWETDGTSAGTWQILVNGSPVVDPGPMVALGNEVLFAENPLLGNNNQVGLWVSDGTSAGTSEISVAGAGSFGVQPTNLTSFGSRVLFAGFDASANGLWITDGTSAGTSEISVNGANSRGVAPDVLTPFGSEALFSGLNADGSRGVWVTDGTSAGTSEISIANLNQVAPAPGDFAALGSRALFVVRDLSNQADLWVTDGTSAGTSELLTGSLGSLKTFGTEVLFDGGSGLWATDGTAAGTTEITSAPVDPLNFTAFGSEVLFEAGFPPGDPFSLNLWVTDGTAAGTTEIAPAPFESSDFTAFGSKVLFEASSATDIFSGNLWVTDGTAAGTSEISVAGAGPNGLFFSLSRGGSISPDFVVYNDKVVFAGMDAAGSLGLWMTDGTAAGTSEISVAGDHPAGINPSALTAFTQNLVRPQLSNVPTNDFPLIQDPLAPSLHVNDSSSSTLASATVSIAGGFPDDGDMLAATTTGTSVTASYNSSTETLVLSGVDTLDNYSRVLSSVTFEYPNQNPTNFGSNPTRTVTWVVDDGGISNNQSLPRVTSFTVIPASVPTLSNAVAVVPILRGDTVTVSPALSLADAHALSLANATVAIIGGTFAGDGDVLAATTAGTSITANYNSTTETLRLTGSDTLAHYQQVLDSVTFDSTSANPTNFGSNPTRSLTWVVNDGSLFNGQNTPVTSAIVFTPPRNDLTGDGMSDVLLQNADGTPQVWLMNGASVTSTALLPDPGSPWHLAASGDFNLDGKADLVLQNTDGLPVLWEMNGASIAGGGALANPGPSWQVIATGDFNADGIADIVLQNTDGLPVVWEMNGTSIIGGGALPDPGPSWRVIGTGDFNGDGKADLLLQNTDGLPVIWEMNGTSIIGGGALPNSGPSWHAIGTGDFNGDGNSDIVWQSTDGLPVIWEMNGTSIIGSAALPNSGRSWHVIGTSDFNGDGKSDIIWQSTDGLPVIWEMNGVSIVGSAALPNQGAAWQVKDDGPIPAAQMGSAPAQLSAPAPGSATGSGLGHSIFAS